jgi:hypothetical protein
MAAGLLFLAACAAPVKRPAVPEPAATPAPGPEKTDGQLQTDVYGSILIDYKAIRIAVDPSPTSSWDFSTVNYVLLTEGAPGPFTARTDIKMMAPPPAVAALQRRGFTQVKGVSVGQRLYLKKNEAFLFVSAVTAGQGEQMKNGYLLEFDNGRNVFIGGRFGSVDPLREFVFSLRDDGKEIYLATVAADSDAVAAQETALLQPRFAFYDPGARSVDRKAVDKTLSDELYPGVFSVLKRGQSVPF